MLTNEGVMITNVQEIINSYCDVQGALFLHRRDLVVALFEQAGIKTLKQFDEIKNFIKLAYSKNFVKTEFYKAVLPAEEFTYDGTVFKTDQQFFEEGMNLSRELSRRRTLPSGTLMI